MQDPVKAAILIALIATTPIMLAVAYAMFDKMFDKAFNLIEKTKNKYKAMQDHQKSIETN